MAQSISRQLAFGVAERAGKRKRTRLQGPRSRQGLARMVRLSVGNATDEAVGLACQRGTEDVGARLSMVSRSRKFVEGETRRGAFFISLIASGRAG